MRRSNDAIPSVTRSYTALQLRVAGLCCLFQLCDGYEIGSIGWVVPSLTHAWSLPPSAFSLAFLFSNIGMIGGALASGPIGDRIGRKPLLLGSVGLFAIASLASAAAPSIDFLAVARVFTGIGIAGGFSGATALTGDYASDERRATLIMITVTGAPLGGFLGGQVASLLLAESFGWQTIFIVGGLFPLFLLIAGIVWLPESPHFSAARSGGTGALLPTAANVKRPDEAGRGNPVRMLFERGYRVQTALFWIIFFCSLVNLYLFVFWLPEVLHLIGLTPAQAVFATSLQTLGGVAAVLYLGWMIDRFGIWALALHFAVGVGFIVLIALVALPYPLLLATVLLSGVTVIGSQTGLNAACGKLYPSRMRTSGYGFASGVGRLGGITAAPLGGLLLAQGWPPTAIFLCACFFAIVAATATAFLARQQVQRFQDG